MRTVLVALVVGLSLGAVACGEGDIPEDVAEVEHVEDVETKQAAIQGGQVETGYPAVGIFENAQSVCTATLISQNFILTAAHCNAPNSTIRLGTDPTYHVIDQLITHPLADLMIGHLAAPIENVPVAKFNEGAVPAVNTVCTSVGYGVNGFGAGETSGTKRSATERITASSVQEIFTQWVTGIADSGDSGGPLFCSSNTIAGVVNHHADGTGPTHQKELYTTVDAAWIQSVIAPGYIELPLLNGWTNAASGTRNVSAAVVSGMVQLKGAISTTGVNPVAFTLPVGMRPQKEVKVVADMSGATKGRVIIAANGTVSVSPEGVFANAANFTSLEGVTFAQAPTGFFPLFPDNGWTEYETPKPNLIGVRYIGSFVHFRGAIKTTGTNAEAFTLPSSYRPLNNVYVPVTLCNAKKGRLFIKPNGVTTVQTEGAFGDAQCQTSLDGAFFARDAAGFTSLSLQNGWVGSPFGTTTPGVQRMSGIVRFKGAISTGTTAAPFTLPAAFRPTNPVYVPLDTVSASKGRLYIVPNGTVTIETPGPFSKAQSFTSLEGVSFTQSEFAPLTLESGWGKAIWTDARAGFAVTAGILHLTGAAGSGTGNNMFTLPVGFRPSSGVNLPVSLCGGTKGRLQIGSAGNAQVSDEGGGLTQAACMTSLEGVTFPLTLSGFTNLTLQNGWVNSTATSRVASAKDIDGIIHLAGAIQKTGGATSPFTLPSAFRPSARVYETVDLCNGSKGRLVIDTTGVTNVEVAGGNFALAACITSLEGVKFAKAANFSAITLANAWAPYGTRNPGMAYKQGIVYLQGSIASGNSAYAFTLPVGYRPATNRFVGVDLCNASRGRVQIMTDGQVLVHHGEGTFASGPQCFTSLEGVSFSLTQPLL